MKKAFNLKFKLSIIVACVLSVAVILGTIALYRRSYFDSVNAIMTFFVGVMSLIISVVALLVSLSTYFSIDSVNAISSMEGNVLCNENYNAEYPLLVKKYSDCKNQQQLEEALFNHLYNELKYNSNTCMEFTDTIQDILDHILWYAYVDTKTQTYKEHINQMIAYLNERYESFSAISNGNQYMLKEHIKLIMNVLNYQSIAHEGGILSPNGKMLNIRGRMFLNGVSKTIYYDYLGLEYHKKAIEFLRNHVGFDGEEFVQENMKKIREYTYTEDEKNELYIYLTKAKEAFDNAMTASKNDILWKGYIVFNSARVDLLIRVLEHDFTKGWDALIKESIVARYTVMKIFAQEETSSFLGMEFKKEYYYAKSLYLLLQTYCEGRNAEREQEAQAILDTIPALDEENGVIFKRTRTYIDDIFNPAA